MKAIKELIISHIKRGNYKGNNSHTFRFPTDYIPDIARMENEIHYQILEDKESFK